MNQQNKNDIFDIRPLFIEASQSINQTIQKSGNSRVMTFYGKVKYKLGNKIFKTKCEIRKYIKELLNRHTIGTEIIGDDLALLKDLIGWHPDRIVETDSKISIERNDYGHRHFVLNGEPFSYIKCIKSSDKGRNRRFNVLRACRNAIQPDIDIFLNKSIVNGGYVCEISKIAYPRHMIHVDHHFERYPFIKIVRDYLLKYNYTWGNIKLRNLNTGGWALTNVDKFREFHNERAVLRIINKTLNLTASKFVECKTCKA